MGVSTKNLQVKIKASKLRGWSKTLKKDYPDQFKQLSSLDLGVDYIDEGLTAAAGAALPLSVADFMAQQEEN